MRLATYAVFGAMLTVFSSGQLRAEEPSWWWPFGSGDESAQAQVSAAPQAHTVAPPESESWFSWPTMPEWSWPESPFSSDEKTAEANPERHRRRYGVGKAAQTHRNRWAQDRPQSATPSDDDSPWEIMTESAHRIGESTRNAWNKTVDFVTPGDDSPEAPVVRQASRDSWWNRMRGASTPQPQGPQTVTEWMAQERLDP